jgi:DNA methylase
MHSTQATFGFEIPKSDERRINMRPIHVSKSTFQAGLAERIHRWFRLTPSFGPDLVHEMLGRMEATRGQTILDPFSGAGTTAIEAQLEGFNCVGFEINPLLHFVGTTSLNWAINPSEVTAALAAVVDEFMQRRPTVERSQLEDEGYFIPPIHNVHRWWRDDVLRDLSVLVFCLDKVEDKAIRDFMRLSLAGVVVPDLTNVTLGKLQLHFIDRSKDTIDVIKSYKAHTTNMIQDLTKVREQDGLGTSQVLHQDSTDLGSLKLDRKIDHVITSPPYPNRYSYVWNTRPHLYLLRFMTDASEASAIDKKTIGGTWGTATSALQKGVVEPLNKAVERAVEPIAAAIRKEDNLMANYAMHYFNKLTQHVIELDKITAKNVKVAYVLGNSWLKGVYVETDVLFADILASLDKPYEVSEIHRFRRRNSGKDLFESIVYAQR